MYKYNKGVLWLNIFIRGILKYKQKNKQQNLVKSFRPWPEYMPTGLSVWMIEARVQVTAVFKCVLNCVRAHTCVNLKVISFYLFLY